MTHITFFHDKSAQSLVVDELTLEKLSALILGTHADSKAALPWLKLAIFGDTRSELNSLRHDANVLKITGVEMDYDGKQVTFDKAVEMAQKMGINALLYTSPSNKMSAPKWRLLVPTSKIGRAHV